MSVPPPAEPVFDRSTEDVGNIVEFGHVNIRVPDQQLALIFYVMGLGLTRDPYLVTGVDNAWINVGITEGKNREVRRVLDAIGLKVNRLIRVSYGPFQLGTLEPGAIEEIPRKMIRDQLGLK